MFDQLMKLRGEVFRQQPGRLTQRVMLGGTHYFIKQHTGVGWKEIFKNLFQLRWPVLGAQNEWRAIAKLSSLGVSVPVVKGYGQRGFNPARQQSFILMEELTPTMSLEELCQEWKTTPPSFTFKRKLIEEVARITRIMHLNGINHRDLYICHYLLSLPVTDDIKLSLIDLHRAQIRQKTPERWIIKDLSGLYFSSKEAGLSKRDKFRFMKAYRQLPLRDIIQREQKRWEKVERRGSTYRDRNK